MHRLSPGIIYSSFYMLQHLRQYSSSETEILSEYRQIYDENTIDVIEIAECCGLIKRSSGELLITEKGFEYLAAGYEQSYRDILYDYILSIRPSWAGLVTRGRQECFNYLGIDERTCLFDAGLLENPPGLEVIKWWDKLTSELRGDKYSDQVEIGRSGEYLSVLYETRRTKCMPIWQAIESNLSGYDVLSRKSVTEDKPLLIEVKASSDNIENAYAHISTNEWHTAINSETYEFHFWILGKNNSLAVLNQELIKPHIPANYGKGEWESVKIPFVLFTDKFATCDVAPSVYYYMK